MNFWRRLAKADVTTLTAGFYLFVSLVGLTYNYVFFHSFGLNILYFYSLTDIVLSGLKWPALVAICFLVPLLNHLFALSLVNIRRRPMGGIATLALLAVLAAALLDWQLHDWRLPGLLYILLFSSLIAASVAASLRKPIITRRRVAGNIAGVGSFFAVLLIALVWSMSNVQGYYLMEPRTLVFVGGATGKAINDSHPWQFVGSTQTFAFFLERNSGRLDSLPWEAIKRIEVRCPAGDLTADGPELDRDAVMQRVAPACAAPTLAEWSLPDFDLLWPFSGKAGAKVSQ